MASGGLDPASLEFFNSFFGVDFSGVRVRSHRWLARFGLAGIALGKRRVFLSDRLAREYAFRTPEAIALLGHELCHIAQWRKLGIMRFLCRYLREYCLLRLIHRKSHYAAYRNLSLEDSAFRAEEEILFLLQQQESGLLHRLQLSAEVGGSHRQPEINVGDKLPSWR